MEQLTDRELEILALLAEGCRNREIASRLGTREQTIKNQLTRIYKHTGTRSRLDLVLMALKRGHVSLRTSRSRESPGQRA